MTEDETVGWHHRLDGHEYEQAPGVGDGQGSLACCSPWGHKKSDTTEQLNLTELKGSLKTQRDGVGREVGGGSGWGTHVNPWLIHVHVWQKPLQYCKAISL